MYNRFRLCLVTMLIEKYIKQEKSKVSCWMFPFHLLPSGSKQHEVMRVVSIPTGILLYCLQSSRTFR